MGKDCWEEKREIGERKGGESTIVCRGCYWSTS